MSISTLARTTPTPVQNTLFERVDLLAKLGLGLNALLAGTVALLGFGLHRELAPLVYGRAFGALAASLVVLLLAAKLRAGRRWAFIRLRIVVTAGPIGLLLAATLPGPYPIWVRLEQAMQAVIMIGMATAVHQPALRALFPKQK